MPAPHARRIGKYEILAKLASGGTADVYLAVLGGPGGFRKLVVLKRILPNLREDREFVDMLLDEARITAALSHSSIAQVFDLGEEEGELFLVMEFVAGQDLSRVRRVALRRGIAVPIGLTCRIARDVCLALHYAHTFVDPGGNPFPVIHRDISARNVMITYAGGVKVIDFGIAKAKGLLERTQSGVLKGSVGYMSPEQALGGQLDGRSDLFSVGVLLHELLTGARLFRVGGDDSATIDRLFAADVAPPHTLNPNVPPALSAVVLKSLERHREERYASGKAMATAIEETVPGALFDDEKVAWFMRDLFAADIEQTRLLLTPGPDGDRARDALAGGELAGAPHLRAEEVATAQAPVSGSIPVVTPVSWQMPAPPPLAAQQPAVVLAVDDSKVGLKLIDLHLGRSGFHVVTASSGDEALEVLEEMRPDLILLDVVMPKMNGFDLCKAIRDKYDPTIPLIFVSAACSLEERTTGLSVGADDFLRKPYDPAELVARVRAHLRRVASLRRTDAEGLVPR